MIKRFIACLTICLIITGLISPVFSNASALPQPNWSDPGISEIINISDLTGWMLNGGTYDVSTYTDAESFMNDYFNARTQTRLVSPGEVQEDYYEVLPGFGINNQLVAGESFARPLETNRVIASSFRDHTGYGRRLSNEVNEALLSSGRLYDTKIPLLNEIEFANFVGYNHDALNLYASFFQNSSPDSPSPNPDPNYISYLDIINGPGFDNWLNYHTTYSYNYNNNIWTTPKTLNNTTSYFYYSRITNEINPNNSITLNWNDCVISNISDIYIISNNDLYSFTVNLNFLPYFLNWNRGDDTYFYLGNDRMTISPDNKIAFGHRLSTDINSSYTFSYSGSLENCFKVLSNSVHNVNIYVNNVLWSLAGVPTINPTITPEFPDAVGGDELPSTTWPIFRPRAPYYTSVPGMLQAIEDAIDDDGKLDIDDLKPYLTDENGDPVPDPIFDPEPVPIPVPDPVNPDVVPGLPELPVIPLDMPSYNGVSVLAEIINFTNRSLPTSLIVTFWGIVFGIVILGLIKILHK